MNNETKATGQNYILDLELPDNSEDRECIIASAKAFQSLCELKPGLEPGEQLVRDVITRCGAILALQPAVVKALSAARPNWDLDEARASMMILRGLALLFDRAGLENAIATTFLAAVHGQRN